MATRTPLSGLEADRRVTIDFTDDLSVVDGNTGLPPTPRVTDRYVVRNSTDKEQSTILFYPWAGSLSTYEGRQIPAVTVDGRPLELDMDSASPNPLPPPPPIYWITGSNSPPSPRTGAVTVPP